MILVEYKNCSIFKNQLFLIITIPAGNTMEIRNLITFLEVAETKNFTRAAEKLGYSQSAVTVQIKQLENELGISLFDRIGKAVSLTEYGTAFVEFASDAVSAMERAESFNTPSEQHSGVIRFGVVGSILSAMLIDVIREFKKMYPNVTICVTEGPSAELEKKIRRCEIDLAYFLDYKTPSNDWVRIREEKEPIIFVTHPSNPLCRKESVKFEELLGEDFILKPKGENYRSLFDGLLVDHNTLILPKIELENSDMIMRLLMKEPYVSVLPEFCVRKYLKSGKLAKINVEDSEMYQYSQLAYLKGKAIPPHLQCFIDTILEKC